MKDFFPFLIAGLVTGSVYGLAATGLVLTYRTSGIFNFAHGAIAAVGAYLFFQLRQEWSVPWPFAVAIVVGVVAVVAGVVFERLARGLEGTTTAAKVVATVGVMIALQGLLSVVYGPATRYAEPFLPTRVFSIAGTNIGLDQLIVFLLALGATVALTQYLRLTVLGTAMRAVVDDSDLLGLMGTSPTRVRRTSWAIGAALAAMSGVLLAPTIGLDPNLLTLLVIQAFGAAAVGRFTSLPLTFGGGLVVGVVASLSTKYVSQYRVLGGFPPAVPFIVLFAVLVLARRGRLIELGTTGVRSVTRRVQIGTKAGIAGAAILLAALVAVPAFAGPRMPVYSVALIYMLMFASLRLLVVTSGQVSLCHATFAAVGATTFAHLTTGAGVPWLLALVLAGLVAVPVGAIVAVPATRLSGVYLALATFGFAVLVERLVYPMAVMFGTGGPVTAPRPDLTFFDSTTPKGYYYVALVVVVVSLAAIRLISHSRLGRLLRGMADSPVALATLGATVNITRIAVFSVSAFFAGVAGALFAARSGTFNPISFPSFLSLLLVVVLAVAGSGELLAPVIAAAALHLMPSYANNTTFSDYLPVLFGAGAVTVGVLSNPRVNIFARLRELAERRRQSGGATRITVRSRLVEARREARS